MWITRRALLNQQTGIGGGPVESAAIIYVSDAALLTNNYDYYFWNDTAPYANWEQWENGSMVRSEDNVATFADVTWTAASTNREIRVKPPTGGVFGDITQSVFWSSYYITGFNDVFRTQLTGLDYLLITGHHLQGELGDWSSLPLLYQLEMYSNGIAAGYGWQTADLFECTNVLSYVDFNGGRLNAAGVNRILAKLDAAGYVGGYVDLSGGTIGAPDTTSGGFNGVAAAANLAGKSWDVFTN